MIDCEYKRWGTKYYFKAFSNNEDFVYKSDCYCSENMLTVNAKNIPENAVINKFHSIKISLSDDIDTIFSNIDKNTRYDIKRAERDGIKTYQLEGDKLSIVELKKFLKFFNSFAKQKSLPKINKQIMYALQKNKNLMLSYATDDSMSNVLVYHLYFKDNEKSLLQHSCSLYRNKKINGQLVGRANRLLHFSDLKYLKENNVLFCDLGGISSNVDIANISGFKKEFGGDIVEYENIAIYNNKKKTLLVKLKDLVKKILKKK